MTEEEYPFPIESTIQLASGTSAFVPVRYSPIIVDSNALEKIKPLTFELYLDEARSIYICHQYFKDRVFFDIGASIGIWSIYALLCFAKQVYAFDPLPENIVPPAFNNFNRVICNVSNRPGYTIDWFARYFGMPGVIKIDVEGDELEVLKGATDVLKTKPVLMIEAHPGKRDGVIELLGEPVKDIEYRNDNITLHHLFYNL